MKEAQFDFEKHADEQLRVAKSILKDDELAAMDACQEARKNVLKRGMRSVEPIRSFWPYLRKATVNACYKELRRRYRERDRFDRAVDGYFIAEARDPSMAAMLADVLLTSDHIVREHFGPPDLAIFRLRYYDGLKLQEIASKVGLSYSTVKKHHRAIIAKIRQTLA